MQRKQHAFTLIELLVVISIIALLIGILLPALGSARRTARQMQNSTHVRGIHSGMILVGQGNKDYFPGATSAGIIDTTTDLSTGTNVYTYGTKNGALPTWRMAYLLRGNFFSPEYMRSPSEGTENGISEAIIGTAMTDGKEFSYAMLNITAMGLATADARTGEWKSTTNSRAVIISDRNIGTSAAGVTCSSIHAPTEAWRGSVCYNDNHATFETTSILKTEYNQKGENSNASGVAIDNLFVEDDGNTTNTTADAAMVFKTISDLVSQKP